MTTPPTNPPAPAAPTASVAPPGSPIVVSLADVTPTPVRWLWPGRIPLGRITLLSGRPGEGKSFLSIDIAARVTTGRGWPGDADDESGDGFQRPGSVLFIAAEDGLADTLRPRLDACGADASRVAAITGVVGAPRQRIGKAEPTEDVFTLSDAHALEAALDRLRDPRLIVIDPIGSYLGGDLDANADNKVRGLLAPVAAIAERRGVAVLIVAHTRKSAVSHADDAVMGSRAFTGLARSVLHLVRDPDDDARRLLLPGKNNLAATPPGLAFALEGESVGGEAGPRVVWQPGTVDRSASDVMNALAADGGTENAVTEAADWLRDMLYDGPKTASEITAAARSDAISHRSLRRAKDMLGVTSAREGFASDGRWLWAMPRDAGDVPDDHPRAPESS